MNKVTSPLAKAITTLEGQLVAGITLVVGVAAALPSHLIPPKIAAFVAGGLNLALIIQRMVIKVQGSKTQAQIFGILESGHVTVAELGSLLKAVEGDLSSLPPLTGSPGDQLLESARKPDAPTRR